MAHPKLSAALVIAAAVLASSRAAHADLSRNVITAYRGQVVISKDELSDDKDDKTTIANIKKARLSEVIGEQHEEVAAWHFHYTAFLTKAGSSSLKLTFTTADKDKHYSADQSLEGVDPKSNVLSGEIQIDEDQGLAKGKSYIVKLENDKGETVAQTPLTMK